jgi:hypothetical protein
MAPAEEPGRGDGPWSADPPVDARTRLAMALDREEQFMVGVALNWMIRPVTMSADYHSGRSLMRAWRARSTVMTPAVSSTTASPHTAGCPWSDWRPSQMRVCSGRRRVRPRHGNRHDADCAPRRRRANFLAIVIHRQEVSPMNAVSAVGAPLQSTIARLS